MRADLSDEKRRAALSCRGLEREYGVGRAFTGELIRLGVLPALRRGRSLLVLRSDFERLWTTREAPDAKRARLVARLLAATRDEVPAARQKRSGR